MNLEKYPNLEAILSGTVAGSFRDWIAVRPELEKLVVRVDGLETVLKLVQRWGKDSRSVGAWEVFQEVARVLEPVTEQPITVVDCTCIACTCPKNEGNYCLSCGVQTYLAHVLALKSGGPR